jgi:putative ABC transport system substrate-binding protein
MKRRDFITLLGGAALAWPLAAREQQPEQMHRIIVLMGIANDAEAQARAAALRQGLQVLGWTMGRNIQIDYSFADGDTERMSLYAKEAVASGPDLILAVTNPALQAIRDATHSQPIVFLQVSDPVGGSLSKVSRIRGTTSPASRILNRRWAANGCRHLRKWRPLWNTWHSFCIRKHRPMLGSCEPQRPRQRLWG